MSTENRLTLLTIAVRDITLIDKTHAKVATGPDARDLAQKAINRAFTAGATNEQVQTAIKEGISWGNQTN